MASRLFSILSRRADMPRLVVHRVLPPPFSAIQPLGATLEGVWCMVFPQSAQ